MKVRYIGSYYRVALRYGETYEVLSIEDGRYRIFIDAFEDEFLFQPEQFAIVDCEDKDA